MIFNNSARFYTETNKKVSLVLVRNLALPCCDCGQHMLPSWALVSSSAKWRGWFLRLPFLKFCDPIREKTLQHGKEDRHRKKQVRQWLQLPLCLVVLPRGLISSHSFYCVYLFIGHVLQPGLDLGPTAVKAVTPNHWTTREFPCYSF